MTQHKLAKVDRLNNRQTLKEIIFKLNFVTNLCEIKSDAYLHLIILIKPLNLIFPRSAHTTTRMQILLFHDKVQILLLAMMFLPTYQ